MEKKMKEPFNSLKYRYIAMACSAIFIIAGIIMFFVAGFVTGIDFGSGYSEEIKVSPLGFSASYTGDKTAVLSVESGILTLTLRSPEGVETVSFDPVQYPLSGDVAAALEEHGIDTAVADPLLPSSNLIAGFGFPAVLSDTPVRVNYATDTVDVTIEDIREALSSLGSVNVQTVGKESDAGFQIKVNVEEGEGQSDVEARVNGALFSAFGEENIVIMRADFVGPKFSSSLFRDSVLGIALALVLILGYIAVRFRIAYALSSILALVHDVLAMLSFILIFRLEVSSTTIAAVLTIIGYSLNNTIVIFDRIRENVKTEKRLTVSEIISMSVRQSMTRTVITSLTTLFAIVPLAFLGSGDIQLFAVNLTWGLLAGAYSSVFLAPAFLLIFNRFMPVNVEKEKKEEEYSLV